MRGRLCLGLMIASVCLSSAFAAAAPVVAARPAATQSTAASILPVTSISASPVLAPSKAYRNLPLIFESNHGQTNPEVKFLTHGSGYALFLTGNEAVLSLEARSHFNPDERNHSVLRMRLVGAASAPEVSGDNLLPGKSNYLIGNDPAQWHTGIPQYARVLYRNVYAGVDLVYHGSQGQLEYDFEVAPKADASPIAMQFAGADKVSLNEAGDLVLSNAAGEVLFHAPVAYQLRGAEKDAVNARFTLLGENRIGFALGSYDHSRALVIDPVLAYSTYLGGSGEESCTAIVGAPSGFVAQCPAITVDNVNSSYVAGATTSTDFPVTTGAYKTTYTSGAKANVFVAKYNSNGSALVFATYLGGSGLDYPTGIKVDSGFNVILGGTTNSTNFPLANNFINPTLAAGNHVFVSKLNSNGAALLYSTYLGGNGADVASGIAIDSSGLIYVTGTTTSTNFPTVAATNQTTFQTMPLVGSTTQFFFSKLQSNLSGAGSLLYSTYLGGSTTENGAAQVTIGGGIAVDTNNNVYVSGGTNFVDMPVLDAYEAYNPSNSGPLLLDAFVAKFAFPSNNITPPYLVYLTYFGGSGDDVAYAVGADTGGNAYIVGSTTSTDIAPANNTSSYQSINGGGVDAFEAKFGTPCVVNTSGCTISTVPLDYFSYLGGSGTDVGLAVAVDLSNGAYITGFTNSTNFPIVNAPSSLGYGGGEDAFVAKFFTASTIIGSSTQNFATYLGGAGTDIGTSIALDLQNSIYIAGETSSLNFPTSSPVQLNLNGANDAFVTKLGPSLNFLVTEAATPNPVGVGSQVTFTYTIQNNGDTVNGTIFTAAVPLVGATFSMASASPGSCGTASGALVTCNIGAVAAGASATVTIVLIPTVSGTLGNNGSISVPGFSFSVNPLQPVSVQVNDFMITSTPNAAVVPAGVPATYSLQVTPTPAGGTIPNSISLACGSGLPTGAICTFTNNPMQNLNTGAQTSLLVINTVQRVSITTQVLHPEGPIYFAFLPIAGIALLGAGRLRKPSRQSWILRVLLMLAVTSLIFLQLGCSSTAPTTTVSGTPAGTYTVTINATSGTVTRSTAVTIIVQ